MILNLLGALLYTPPMNTPSGQVTDIKAGDSWVFPRGWKGIGIIMETVRKVYLVIS